ncbi:MAG TPA: hypothetical protein VK980_12085 [Sphingomonas sp.]|nr:hypothetical protein [Sphingomonas sp.]
MLDPDDGPYQPAAFIIERDDLLVRRHAVDEGNAPCRCRRIGEHLGPGDEAGHETGM